MLVLCINPSIDYISVEQVRMSQISIKERTDRMIAKDAILLNLYTCKGRNYSCECDDCISLCKSIKKKIDWKTLIHINGNIKGGKNFIRTELPKFSNDKKLITKIKKQEEELLSIKKEEMLLEATPSIVEKQMLEAWRKDVKMDKAEFRKFMKWKDKNMGAWERTKSIIQQLNEDVKLRKRCLQLVSKGELGKFFQSALST